MKLNSETERQIFILKEMVNDMMHNKESKITNLDIITEIAKVIFNFKLEYYEQSLLAHLIDYFKDENKDYNNPFFKEEE